MLPSNALEQVRTYHDYGVAAFQNLCPVISTSNTKAWTFNKETANLGDTINIELPYKYTATNGLVAVFQGTQQNLQPLTADQAFNVSVAFTAQDFIFNVDKYWDKIGNQAVRTLATNFERRVCLNANSHVPVFTVDQDGQSVPTGALHTESGPYRFFGDGLTPINSQQQLAQINANYKTMGIPGSEQLQIYLPDIVIPPIIGTMANQFAPNRNDKIVMSWELGKFNMADYYISNLMPLHTAGNIGNDQVVLTLVSTNDVTGQNVTQLTFSGATGEGAQAVLSGDMFVFQDNVSGQPNLRYLSPTGNVPTSAKVQFRATADAAASGDNVTITLSKALVWAFGPNQNINFPLAAGMQVKGVANHLCGMLVAGKGLFCAMPPLPDESPFVTANKSDPDTKVSIRLYHGSRFGQNFRGLIHDGLLATTFLQDYGMRICFPPI